jgi:hypothetical protein
VEAAFMCASMAPRPGAGEAMATEPACTAAGLQPRVMVVIVPAGLLPAREMCSRAGIFLVEARWAWWGPLLVLFLFVAPSHAAWEVRLIPQITAAAEYNDNVTNVIKQGRQVEDLSLTTTPALTWSFDRQDLRFDGRSGLTVERFLDHGDLDGEDWGHRVGATWRLDERWSLSASEDWRQSRNLDDFIAAGEIVQQRERRTTNDARAAITWLPTERTQASLSYTNYNSQSERTANSDYLLHAVGLNASLQATERLDLFTGGNFQDYDFNPIAGSRTRFFTRNYSGFLGGGYRLSERLSTHVQVGARRTKQTTRGIALDATTFPLTFTELEGTSTSTGTTFDLSATYQLARGQIEARASQDLTATAGAEGTVERRSFRLHASDWFAPDWEWTALFSYTKNQSDTGQSDVVERDSRGTYVVLGLHYRINDYLDATAQLRRSDYRDNAVDTETARNAAVLTITGRWPTTL